MALNGFPTCSVSATAAYKVPGTKYTSIRVNKEMAPLWVAFAAEFNRLVEPLDGYGKSASANDVWGYACRLIRGRLSISYHAAANALDLNATKHPLGASGTFTAAQVRAIRALCKKYGLRWGGDYSGRKDEMHFEFIKSRTIGLAMVRAIQKPVVLNRPVVKPTPRPPAKKPVVVRPPVKTVPRYPGLTREGYQNNPVTSAYQSVLKLRGWPITVDRDHGPETTRMLKSFQRQVGLKQDGIGGPKTWSKLWTAKVT